MRRRRLPDRRPAATGDRMYWPGHVAPGYDPLVRPADVHAVCAERMRVFDELPREVRDRINERGFGR